MNIGLNKKVLVVVPVPLVELGELIEVVKSSNGDVKIEWRQCLGTSDDMSRILVEVQYSHYGVVVAFPTAEAEIRSDEIIVPVGTEIPLYTTCLPDVLTIEGLTHIVRIFLNMISGDRNRN